MKFLLLFLPLFWIQSVSAQDSWTVTFDNKQVIAAKAEDAATTRLQLSAKELKKKSTLKVVYTEFPKKQKWERFIMVVDPKDKELLKVKSDSVSISNVRIASLLKTGKTLRIFTWALPKDSRKSVPALGFDAYSFVRSLKLHPDFLS